MLSARDLSVTLNDGDRHFQLRVDALDVIKGEAVGLTGPSGTGKTLLLELLGLLRKPDIGGQYSVKQTSDQDTDLQASWTGRDANTKRATFRGRFFGFVPQNGGLIPFLNLRQNIEITQKISGRIDDRWVDILCERLGLTDVQMMKPEKLSIGQRQRTAIARALAHRPSIVIADEPTAALDPDSAYEAMNLLFETATIGGSAVLISSHDLSLLKRFKLTRFALRLEKGTKDKSLISRLVALSEVST